MTIRKFIKWLKEETTFEVEDNSGKSIAGNWGADVKVWSKSKGALEGLKKKCPNESSIFQATGGDWFLQIYETAKPYDLRPTVNY